jgi:serine O-acetyltransferase
MEPRGDGREASRSISWRETRQRLQADRERIVEMWRPESGVGARPLLMNPSYQCMLLHRLSAYLFQKGHRLAARLFWQLNLLLTGADIGPLCDLGGGMVIHFPASVALCCRMGRNCTMLGQGGVGGGVASGVDIGAGPGLPVLGDDVLLEAGAYVLGPIRVGSRARIGHRCVVTRDVPTDGLVTSPPAQVSIRRGVGNDERR